MTSVKLSITSRKRLAAKYSAESLTKIDRAVADWVRADLARGIKTFHVAIDDAAGMRRLGMRAVAGRLTPQKVKGALDALVARLAPDYIVLFGAHDVVPMFAVPNPSAAETDDDDEEVPTDNPYACSKKFVVGRRSSYLVPDRVIGRIPDLPGSDDPSWLIDYLGHAAESAPRPAAAYRSSLMLCCHAWRKAGDECAKTLERKASDVLICPPTLDGAATVRRRRSARLHMIKCHGADEDSRFYGERRGGMPDALSSVTLLGKTSPGAVVGAMCCYGGDLFDPASEFAQHPPELPIPSVYLKQGALGFLGASTIAWVGNKTMMCADWIVTAFLKSATGGASLGRATLEAKQDFLRWLQQQGAEPDVADEKTLLQFLLLGDPSIHPVVSAAPAARRPAVAARRAAGRALTAAAAAPMAMQRQQRRAARHELGGLLRERLCSRHPVTKAVPPEVAAEARRATADAPGDRKRWRRSHVDRLVTTARAPELQPRVAAAVPGRPGLRAAGPATADQVYQYYWVTRQGDGVVPRISLVTVQADSRGRVLGSRVVFSS